ncbi:uncharacterized protein [Eleutherodactylus coqui]|uniref:uncharacterized protein n=1 Tax=Eleutherodactylus coqui TaxID=57060 RepID=UPI0034634695
MTYRYVLLREVPGSQDVPRRSPRRTEESPAHKDDTQGTLPVSPARASVSSGIRHGGVLQRSHKKKREEEQNEENEEKREEGEGKRSQNLEKRFPWLVKREEEQNEENEEKREEGEGKRSQNLEKRFPWELIG